MKTIHSHANHVSFHEYGRWYASLIYGWPCTTGLMFVSFVMGVICAICWR